MSQIGKAKSKTRVPATVMFVVYSIFILIYVLTQVRARKIQFEDSLNIQNETPIALSIKLKVVVFPSPLLP